VPLIGECVPTSWIYLETLLRVVYGPLFHEVRPLSTFHVTCRSVLHTLHPHSLNPHAFPLKLTLSSLELVLFLLKKVETLVGKWKHLNKRWKESVGLSFSQCASLALLSHPHLIHLPFPFNLKAHALIGWIFSLSCLFPWMFDTC
jgi:hypothetical protein